MRTPPVIVPRECSISRSQKMAALIEDMGLVCAGAIYGASADSLVNAIKLVLQHRPGHLPH